MRDNLCAVQDEPRPPRPPPPTWWDWTLVAVLVPVAVIEGALRPDLPGRAMSVVVAAGLVPTLLRRGSRPSLMLAVAFVVTVLASLPIGGDPATAATRREAATEVAGLAGWTGVAA